MSKLVIDERDLRCTILEGVRHYVGPDARAESIAQDIIDRVIACGDPIDNPPGLL